MGCQKVTEKEIERRLCETVRKCGGLTYKLIGLVNGLPDRIVILPDGAVWFVELKTEKGRLSKIQQFQIGELEKRGANVRVIRGLDGAREFIEEVMGDADRV